MSLPTPEEVAANQARLRRKPASATIVPAPYDVITVHGIVVARGEPVWQYVSGRQYGGPSDMSLAAAKGEKPVEYAYMSIARARLQGWEDQP